MVVKGFLRFATDPSACPQRVMWWYHWHCKERPEKWQQTFPFHKDRPGETLVIIILMNFAESAL